MSVGEWLTLFTKLALKPLIMEYAGFSNQILSMMWDKRSVNARESHSCSLDNDTSDHIEVQSECFFREITNVKLHLKVSSCLTWTLPLAIKYIVIAEKLLVNKQQKAE